MFIIPAYLPHFFFDLFELRSGLFKSAFENKTLYELEVVGDKVAVEYLLPYHLLDDELFDGLE